MSSFFTLRKSSPLIYRFPIQRSFKIRNSSTTSPSSSSSSPSAPSLLNRSSSSTNPHYTPPRGSGLGPNWAWALAAGSGLGVLLHYLAKPNSQFDSPFLSKLLPSVDSWSTPPGNEVESDRRSTPSLFRKLSLPESSSFFLIGDAYRRKVFFNYEKRIRLRSPPEKVFEYFASYRTPEGELLMKPADLMRAVVPVFPPSESHLVRDGYLKGERSPGHLRCAPSEFFMLFDVNGDGLISFKEYIFFVTLLSIPESSFSIAFKMFDVDNNGEINKEEFKKVMALMRSHHRQGVQHRDGLRIGLKVIDSVENGGMLEYFFGKDGNECLQHDKFVQFLRDLHEEIVRLEFSHYDYKSQKTISAKDFGLSMVASADIGHLDKLLDRVDQLDNDQRLKNVRITFEEFKNFAELRKKLLPFSLALFSCGKVNGLLTRDDFQRAASQVCGISLSDNVVDIVFHLFDANWDRNLSADEFVRVLHKRERDIVQPVEAGIFGFLSCCWNCTDNLSRFRLF